MNMNLKHFFSTALLTGLTGAALFAVACGPAEEESCTLNTDCDAGFICNTDTNTCIAQTASCTSSADCTDDLLCIASPDNDPGVFVCGNGTTCGDFKDAVDADAFCNDGVAGEVCGTDGTCGAPAACDTAEDPTAFCTAELGVDGVCNAAGVCEEAAAATSQRFVLISDVTTAGCTDTNQDGKYDPGSDIMYVELRDANGQSLAWGTSVEYEKANDANNDYTDDSIIDGMAPSNLITTGEDIGCPDGSNRFDPTTVVSLGCTGSLLVEFNADIYNGHVVNVGEYAPICNQNTGGSATGTDKYDVVLCPPTAAGVTPTIAECLASPTQISATDAGGIKASTVSGAQDEPN